MGEREREKEGRRGEGRKRKKGKKEKERMEGGKEGGERGDLPNPGIEPRSPAFQAGSLLSEPPGKPKNTGAGSQSPAGLPDPGIEPRSPVSQGDCLPRSPVSQGDCLPAELPGPPLRVPCTSMYACPSWSPRLCTSTSMPTPAPTSQSARAHPVRVLDDLTLRW